MDPLGRPRFRAVRLVLRAVVLLGLAVALLLVVLAATVAPVATVATRVARPYTRLELPEAPEGPQTTFVYDRKGRLLARLHAGVNRTVIPGDQIPQHLKDAVVAVEDKDFYRHGGVSAPAILRAALADLTSRRIEQGGSTITQQYVKNVYVGTEKSLQRKLKEAILAVRLEDRLSKDQILTKYLNTVYFGRGAYGVQAAAQTYFGKPARKLTLLESATLAALIPAPARYDPQRNRKAAVARRNHVLAVMAEQGYIGRARAARLQRRPIRLRPPRPDDVQTSYFVDWVTRKLVDRFGYDRTFAGGLRVRTSLDLDFQRVAEDVVARYLPDPRGPAAALVAMDPRSGQVLAMVGGRNFNKRKFNLALQAHRQTGSAFKTFGLVAALEKGISLNSVWSGPASTVIRDRRCLGPGGEPWQVGTYEGTSFGTMTLAAATAASVNTVYARLVVEVGPEAVADVARRMGIRTRLQAVCSIVLGSQSVTPLDMTTAYATLAARGVRHLPRPIVQVRTARGKVEYRARRRGRRVLDPNIADLATWTLQRVVLGGTGTRAYFGRPAAGKTGTAQNHVDVWFCGYIPQLTACVWVGYPKAEIPLYNVGGFYRLFGGSIPAMIWHDFMATVTQGMPVQSFHTPDFSVLDYYPPGTAPAPPPPSPTESPPPIPRPSPGPPEEPGPPGDPGPPGPPGPPPDG